MPTSPLRLVLFLAALGALVWIVAAFRSDRPERERLVTTVREAFGDAEPSAGALAGILREPDLERARLLAARLLFSRALDTRDLATLPDGRATEAWIERRLDWLEHSHDLARAALLERPAAWQGLMIVGGTTYLERSLRRERSLITEHRDWEAPLLAALELSSDAEEPQRLLAMAYLEVWPILSERKRETARELLTVALRDPDSFRALLDPWLTVASDVDDAFAVLPDAPHVWEQVGQRLARSGDWQRSCEARSRTRRALAEELESQLVRATDRLRGGDRAGARPLLLEVIRRAPAEGGFEPLVTRAFELLPAGPLDRQLAPALRAWLVWSLDRCLFGDCRLPPAALGRMAPVVAADDPVLAARVLLAEGRLVDAERREDAASLGRPAWGPYLLQKTPLLIDGGRPDDARRSLARLHPEWADHPLRFRHQQRLSGVGETVATAPSEGSPAARSSWATREWWPAEEGRLRLDLEPAAAAPGLAIELDEVPPAGAAVEIRLDGEIVACRAVGAESTTGERDRLEIVVPVALDPRPHRLEAGAIAGGRVLPGAVRLLGREELDRLEAERPRELSRP